MPASGVKDFSGPNPTNSKADLKPSGSLQSTQTDRSCDLGRLTRSRMRADPHRGKTVLHELGPSRFARKGRKPAVRDRRSGGRRKERPQIRQICGTSAALGRPTSTLDYARKPPFSSFHARKPPVRAGRGKVETSVGVVMIGKIEHRKMATLAGVTCIYLRVFSAELYSALVSRLAS